MFRKNNLPLCSAAMFFSKSTLPWWWSLIDNKGPPIFVWECFPPSPRSVSHIIQHRTKKTKESNLKGRIQNGIFHKIAVCFCWQIFSCMKGIGKPILNRSLNGCLFPFREGEEETSDQNQQHQHPTSSMAAIHFFPGWNNTPQKTQHTRFVSPLNRGVKWGST